MWNCKVKRVNAYVILLNIAKSSSTEVISFCTSFSKKEDINFSTTSPWEYVAHLLNLCQSDMWKLVSICGFNFRFSCEWGWVCFHIFRHYLPFFLGINVFMFLILFFLLVFGSFFIISRALYIIYGYVPFFFDFVFCYAGFCFAV